VDEGLADGCRDSDGDEAVLRVEIVFAAFIHDPDVPVRLGVGILHDLIYLVQFQRRGVICVVHTNNVS